MNKSNEHTAPILAGIVKRQQLLDTLQTARVLVLGIAAISTNADAAKA